MAALRDTLVEPRPNLQPAEQDPKAPAPSQGEDRKECHGLIIKNRNVLPVLKKQG